MEAALASLVVNLIGVLFVVGLPVLVIWLVRMLLAMRRDQAEALQLARSIEAQLRVPPASGKDPQ